MNRGKCLELIDSLSEQQLYVRNEQFADFYKYVLSEIRDYANMYGIAKYAYTLAADRTGAVWGILMSWGEGVFSAGCSV